MRGRSGQGTTSTATGPPGATKHLGCPVSFGEGVLSRPQPSLGAKLGSEDLDG